MVLYLPHHVDKVHPHLHLRSYPGSVTAKYPVRSTYGRRGRTACPDTREFVYYFYACGANYSGSGAGIGYSYSYKSIMSTSTVFAIFTRLYYSDKMYTRTYVSTKSQVFNTYAYVCVPK